MTSNQHLKNKKQASALSAEDCGIKKSKTASSVYFILEKHKIIGKHTKNTYGLIIYLIRQKIKRLYVKKSYLYQFSMYNINKRLYYFSG